MRRRREMNDLLWALAVGLVILAGILWRCWMEWGGE